MSPNPYDARDQIEHAEIAALLEQLPAEHPAREAYGRGVTTIELTHLVADRVELVDGLKKAYLAGFGPVLVGSSGFRL